MEGKSKSRKNTYVSPKQGEKGAAPSGKYGFTNSPFRSNVLKAQPIAPATNGVKNMSRAKSPKSRQQFTVGCRVVVSTKQNPQPRSGVVVAVCFGSLKVQTTNGTTIVANKTECVLDHSFRPAEKVPQTTKEARSTSKERHPRPVVSTRLRSPERYGSKTPDKPKAPMRSSSSERKDPPKRLGSPTRATSPKRSVTAIHRAPKVATDNHAKPRRERSPAAPDKEARRERSLGAEPRRERSFGAEPRRERSPGTEERRLSGKHVPPRSQATTPPPRKKKAADFSASARSVSASKKKTKSNTHSHVQPRQADYFNRMSSVPTMPAKGLNFGEGGYGHVMTGDILHHQYLVIKQLGRGQSSTVWLAQDKTLKPGSPYEFVAIKVTRCAPNVVSSALHEVALLYYLAKNNPFNPTPKLNKLDSGGVSRLLNHFEHRGLYGTHICMVFELLGQPLDALMAKNGFKGVKDIKLVKGITVSILRTLRQLREVNVVHTDLKPENLMFVRVGGDVAREVQKYVDGAEAIVGVGGTCDVKISDFGLSFLLKSKDGLKYTGEPLDDTDLKLIRASNYMKGALIQTREYRAPEIILGNDFGCESDIWSLGCIVYEMMTGKFLFDPKSKPNITTEFANDAQHLSEITQVIGRPPSSVLKSGVYASRFYDPAERFKAPHNHPIPDAKSMLSRRSSKEDSSQCYDFVMRCLTWSPNQRPTANELLNHPWLAGFA